MNLYCINPTVYQYTIPTNLITFLLVKIKLTGFCGELGRGENGFFGFGHRKDKTVANLGWLF